MLLHVNSKEEDLQHASIHSLCFRNPIQLVSSVRYLGIQLNSDLSWSPHITNLCTKARQLVGLLYRRFYKHANTSTLLQLYKSFIRPHLEYCAIVWDPHLLKDVEALEKVQRFVLRTCLMNWSLDHDQLYQQSNLPPFVNRRSNAKLCHLYRIVNDLCDFLDAPVQQRELFTITGRQILYSSPTCRLGPTNFTTLISQKLFLFGTLSLFLSFHLHP